MDVPVDLYAPWLTATALPNITQPETWLELWHWLEARAHAVELHERRPHSARQLVAVLDGMLRSRPTIVADANVLASVRSVRTICRGEAPRDLPAHCGVAGMQIRCVGPWNVERGGNRTMRQPGRGRRFSHRTHCPTPRGCIHGSGGPAQGGRRPPRAVGRLGVFGGTEAAAEAAIRSRVRRSRRGATERGCL